MSVPLNHHCSQGMARARLLLGRTLTSAAHSLSLAYVQGEMRDRLLERWGSPLQMFQLAEKQPKPQDFHHIFINFTFRGVSTPFRGVEASFEVAGNVDPFRGDFKGGGLGFGLISARFT